MKVFFIGNRYFALRSLLKIVNVENINIYALHKSPLQRFLKQKKINHSIFKNNEKEKILKLISDSDFDYLISNGLPFLIPVSQIKKSNQFFINIHPTLLPYLKGKTPINGVFFNKMNFFGATMHHMNDKFDDGEIIFQKKQKITSDLNLAMLYYMSFRLESEVFSEGFQFINKKSNINYLKLNNKGSFFNRTKDKTIINFSNDDDELIIRKIKSFGISSQGCKSIIDSKKITIFDGKVIKNKKFLNWFKDYSPGSIVLELDGCKYVKTINSVLRIEKSKWD